MWIEEFVECLEKHTDVEPRIMEGLAIKQQNLPERIYKYRRDCSYSRNCLKSKTVWLSSPEAYNDPYDSWVKFAGWLCCRVDGGEALRRLRKTVRTSESDVP